MRLVTGVCIIVTIFAARSAQAEPADNALKIYSVQMLQGSPQFIGGAGIYLGKGLVITAAHVAGPNHPGVRIDDLNVSAKMVKGGTFETIDLALFSISEEQLPNNFQLLSVPLCQTPSPVGAPVIVVAPQRITRSRIVSPLLVDPLSRTKFSTLISDVDTGGRSGSGVFDAETKCLLGILSAKITNSAHKEIGTYFVSASTIQSFVPPGTRW
jgi:hypothetical protein